MDLSTYLIKEKTKIINNNYNTIDYFNNLFDHQKITTAGIHTSNKCNLKCKHCFYYQNQRHQPEMGIDSFRDTINQCVEIGVNHFHFCGREPFFNSTSTDLSLYIKDKFNDCLISAITNGMLIDNYFSMLAERQVFDWIDFSIDGDMPAHEYLRGNNTFDKLVFNIHKSIELNIAKEVRTTTVVSTINKDTLCDIIKILYDVGIRKMFFQPFQPLGSGLALKEFSPKASDYFDFITMIEDFIYRKNFPELSIKISIYPTHLPYIIKRHCDIMRQYEAFMINKNAIIKNIIYQFHVLCTAFADYIKILPNGDVLGCDVFLSHKNYTPYSPGNLKHDTLKNLIQKDSLAKTKYYKELFFNAQQLKCNHNLTCFKYCNSGCIFQANLYNGYRDPLCEAFNNKE